jgi:hypothetical protein
MADVVFPVPPENIHGTAITMENAIAFGFKAGFGFLLVQLIFGVFVGVIWLAVYNITHHL